MANKDKVDHLVVDAGAFIRNAPLSKIGVKFYTLPEVVREIRDKTTRQRLQVLPYELVYRQPSQDSIKIVTEFSKKTGDFHSLSAVDMRLMALAYQLEKEHVGTEHIKTEPDQKISWTASRRHLENPTDIAGFYLNNKDKNKSRTSSESTTASSCIVEEVTTRVEEVALDNEANATDELSSEPYNTNTCTPVDRDSNEEKSGNKTTEQDNLQSHEDLPDTAKLTKTQTDEERIDSQPAEEHKAEKYLKEGDTLCADKMVEGGSSDEEEEDEEEDNDEDGWITPSNIRAVKASMGDANVEKASVPVGCITMDFAMQNVLLQMGLNVVSIDGMLIKKAKSYVLWCSTCFKVTLDKTKEYCYKCGYRTLKKVSMTINEDGSIQYFLSKRKPISTRGLRYSLPTPKGGKYSNDPILCEDQKGAHQRMSKKSKVKYDVFDPDFTANTSPFAPTDIHSRAAQLGIRDHKHAFRNKRNPNENNKVYGRRK